MDNAVEDGIGESGILNLRMPLVDGELGGKETGGAAVAVIQEVEDFAGLVRGQGISEPFIENDEVKGRQLLAEFGERAVDLSELQFREQISGFEIAHGIALLTEVVSETTGEKGFPDTGRADDHQAEMLGEPLPLSPLEELGLFQPPWYLKIDVIERGGGKESGLLESTVEALLLTTEIFALDQEGEAFVKGEVMVRGLSLLLLPGLQETDEAKGFELFKGVLHGDK
jgi:hypothetical protein